MATVTTWGILASVKGSGFIARQKLFVGSTGREISASSAILCRVVRQPDGQVRKREQIDVAAIAKGAGHPLANVMTVVTFAFDRQTAQPIDC